MYQHMDIIRSFVYNKTQGLYYFTLRTLMLFCLFVYCIKADAQNNNINYTELVHHFQSPPEAAKPWVFWYWMNAAVSKEGIKADLIAMKQNGLGGAYLMPISGAPDSPFVQPPAVQLTPLWWDMIRYSFHIADSLHFKLAMHDCDGFALAGGPWITPEKSMQKVVWTKTIINGGVPVDTILRQPESRANYYRDIAVFAYPAKAYSNISTYIIKPVVTTNADSLDASVLIIKNNETNFRSRQPCYMQYAFEQPFTCRSVIIRSRGYNYQANRLLIETSDDGKNFKQLTRLIPPRTGWQDSNTVTHAIPVTIAKYFRFVYDNEGSEPGAEDLDAAKWRQSLSVREITLSAEPFIHQYESKNGEAWRISKASNKEQLPDTLCVPLDSIRNISAYVDASGRLQWNAPNDKWIILRMGHTTTGAMNATGGGGKGLECDKFDTSVVALQFNNWFGETIKQVGPDVAKKVLSIFHVDSWECSSQNWSPVFAGEFKKRRGYDMMDYLPAMAGVPVAGRENSENFLADVRRTIAELVVDNFYGTMKQKAHAAGCDFSAESVAPTMMSDGMMHYKNADLPMGEFWFNSATHDKPNDMLDAISGAHIYNKNMVQAEAFTTLRMDWNETPATLKTIGDRAYAMGVNRFVYHVFVHNPFVDQKPGMTLNGVGLLFQRNNTWWQQGKAWVEYAQRCQAILQAGKPVTDIAVFAGEDEPVRAILPDRLVHALPGILGKERVEAEITRLANKNSPVKETSIDVIASANMADPKDWTDALRGYKYDSFNKDALLHTTVKDGKVVFNNGNAYNLLVFPGSFNMNPNGEYMSLEVAMHLDSLIQQGANIILPKQQPTRTSGMLNYDQHNTKFKAVMRSIYGRKSFTTPWTEDDFRKMGLHRDVEIRDRKNNLLTDLAWAHRSTGNTDIYFISNQKEEKRSVKISLRVQNKLPEIWDAVTGEIGRNVSWKNADGRIIVDVIVEPNQSIFIILNPAEQISHWYIANKPKQILNINKNWHLQFDTAYGGPLNPVIADSLQSWASNNNDSIKYYSGTAVYTNSFELSSIDPALKYSLQLDSVYNMAEVIVNGSSCSTLWTFPYKANVTKAIRPGKNDITIKVTNTWHNRLIYDNSLPKEKRITWTNAPFRLQNQALASAGLVGNIALLTEESSKQDLVK